MIMRIVLVTAIIVMITTIKDYNVLGGGRIRRRKD